MIPKEYRPVALLSAIGMRTISIWAKQTESKRGCFENKLRTLDNSIETAVHSEFCYTALTMPLCQPFPAAPVHQQYSIRFLNITRKH